MNLELKNAKKLDDNTYIVLQNIYKYFFEKYLTENIDITKYNDLIKNSGLDFGIPKPAKINLGTNLKEYLNLEYIYLVNNFFIEKLSEEHLEILKNRALNKNYNFDEEIRLLISSTFKDVIKNNYFKNNYTDKVYKVCYGYNIKSNYADNDSLVLKILYGKNTKELDKEKYIENNKVKEFHINNIKEFLKKEIEDNLNIKCTIISEKIFN